eukprot:13101460-Alexandrium_andersonii.AAC.1
MRSERTGATAAAASLSSSSALESSASIGKARPWCAPLSGRLSPCNAHHFSLRINSGISSGLATVRVRVQRVDAVFP